MTFLHALVLAQSDAAASAQSSGGSPLGTVAPLLIVGVLFYLLIIRPQRKRQADQAALLRRVGAGDEIVTIGGFHGTVVDLDDVTMRLEIAPGVVVTMARTAISRAVSEPAPLPLDDVDDFGDDDDASFDDASFDDAAFDDAAFDDRPLDEHAFDDDGDDRPGSAR